MSWSRMAFLKNIFSLRPVKLTLFYVALVLFVLPFTLTQVAAPDFFKALYTGRYIVEFLQLPHHSFFTFSEVKEIFPPETFNWLGNLTFYGLYQAGGIPLLQWFRLLVLLFYVTMIHAIVGFRVTPMILLLLVTLILGSEQKLLMRNSIFLLPYGALLFWLWSQVRVENRWKWLLGFPVLFLFWGNTHGTFLVGIGLLGLLVLGYLLDCLIRRDFSAWKTLVALFSVLCAVFIVSTVAKPYPDQTLLKVGDQILQHGTDRVSQKLWSPAEVDGQVSSLSPPPNETTQDKREEINPEKSSYFPNSFMRYRKRAYLSLKSFLQNTVFDRSIMKVRGQDFPLDSPRFIYVSTSIALFFITLGSFAITARQFRLEEFLPFVAASVIGFGYLRTVVLIPLVSIPVLFMKHRRGDFLKLKWGKTVQVTALLVVLGLLGNFYYYYAFYNVRHFTASKAKFGFGRATIWGDRMPEYILKNYPDKKIYNLYGIGTFLNWKWYGQKKVLVDGKNRAYSPEFFRELSRLPISDYIKKHGINYVLVPYWKHYAFSSFIPSPEYELVAFDSAFLLFRLRKNADARNVSPEEVFLHSKEEFREFPVQRQEYMKLVGDFVERYQNQNKWIGVFTSPFQRHKDDIGERFKGIDLNELPDQLPAPVN